MGWRFRKSLRVGPGLRLNLSKSGISASVGHAPLTANVGNGRTMLTASLPGTGLQYRAQRGTRLAGAGHLLRFTLGWVLAALVFWLVAH